MKKSTRAFLKEARKTKSFSLLDLIHGYFYMRWPYFYIGMGKGDHPLSKKLAKPLGWLLLQAEKFGKKKAKSLAGGGFAEGYHGKVLPLSSARQLVSVQKEIRLENLEQVIPFERARQIILKNPDHIVALNCPCRKGMPNPCQPLDVCLIVGEPFSSFVLEHNPADCRAITQDEARQILEDENKRGHVAHAYFKDAVLNRFYAICNCCSCCCGAMKAHRSGTPMIISSGYTIKVNRETCLACGDCVSSCQFGALSVNGELQINCDACMGCGVCVSHCPQEALFLERDETKPAPLELEELIQVSSI